MEEAFEELDVDQIPFEAPAVFKQKLTRLRKAAVKEAPSAQREPGGIWLEAASRPLSTSKA